MNRSRLFLISLLFLCLYQLTACHKEKTPVDLYIEAIDMATEKMESLDNIDQIQEVQTMVTDQANLNLQEEYGDYMLTDKDKEKLKKSVDKFVKASYDKISQLAEFPTELNSQKEQQVQMIISEINEKIDKATTLGNIPGF